MQTRPLVRDALTGAALILAVVAFLVGTAWLRGKDIAQRRTAVLEFRDVTGVKVGTPVAIAGFPVGKVMRIALEGRDRVAVTVTLPDTIVLRRDASAHIASEGLVGNALVSIDPGGAAEPLPPGARVLEGQTGGILERANRLGDRADSVMLGAQRLMSEAMADRLARALEQLDRTLAAAERTATVYGDREAVPFDAARRALEGVATASARFDSTLADPAVRRALGQADTLTRALTRLAESSAGTARRLDSLLAGMERGEGTLGRLARDAALYEQLVRTTASLDSLLRTIQRNPSKVPVTVKLF